MCFYCTCKTMVPAVTTHTVTLETKVIVVKNVPCEACEQCGEKYLSDEVMEELERIVGEAKEQTSEVCVIDYNARVA